ncbi:F-box protein pof7 [Coleophoma cylindrospora]|uniref:F-box protein pof7 n=1 Tax=Coleophoma cylindrospora TaxID=1849047 RepID=A0A3D8RHE9_9HELO|nr:F-box protein pof7 [Coleophoma cylindrospora]
MDDSNSELESFRRQWRAEVTAKAKDDRKTQPKSTASASKAARRPVLATRYTADKTTIPADDQEDDEPHVEGPPLRRLDAHSSNESESSKNGSTEPRSALEHYEKAVEKETEGSLGDSLNLYRKAFRMDHRVDQKYKTKHFPPSSFPAKPANPNPSDAPVTVPNTAHHSLDGPPQTIKELIAGFAGLSIETAPPAIEGTEASPCFLAELPDEILIQICTETAIQDVAAFVKLSLVCKRLAYLVATEEQVWRRVCLGSEIGFRAMHYDWQREILGGPIEEDDPVLEDDLGECATSLTEESLPLGKDQVTMALYQNIYASSWRQMFRLRPRIRFNGCYISTVNYIRPGQGSQSQVTWHNPVLIVTYYRYLRFFRDGTVISLLTTTEPSDVVHHLTKELADTHRNGGAPHLPSIVMQNALRGRWRLSTMGDSPEASLKDAEGDVVIETEGATGARYIYRMELSLRSSGKGAKNNKLVWRGFWSHNVLTDDVAPFTLRNDKAFFWSRVKSYGMGS